MTRPVLPPSLADRAAEGRIWPKNLVERAKTLADEADCNWFIWALDTGLHSQGTSWNELKEARQEAVNRRAELQRGRK